VQVQAVTVTVASSTARTWSKAPRHRLLQAIWRRGPAGGPFQPRPSRSASEATSANGAGNAGVPTSAVSPASASSWSSRAARSSLLGLRRRRLSLRVRVRSRLGGALGRPGFSGVEGGLVLAGDGPSPPAKGSLCRRAMPSGCSSGPRRACARWSTGPWRIGASRRYLDDRARHPGTGAIRPGSAGNGQADQHQGDPPDVRPRSDGGVRTHPPSRLPHACPHLVALLPMVGERKRSSYLRGQPSRQGPSRPRWRRPPTDQPTGTVGLGDVHAADYRDCTHGP
jgi:hypothetical protein